MTIASDFIYPYVWSVIRGTEDREKELGGFAHTEEAIAVKLREVLRQIDNAVANGNTAAANYLGRWQDDLVLEMAALGQTTTEGA